MPQNLEQNLESGTPPKDPEIAAQESSGDPPQETPFEALASICSVLVLGLFALTFIFQNFVIPSGSMEKTLLIGDHVVVERENLAPPSYWAPFLHYRNIQRGDIIVFFKPDELMYLVKRVIGVPGDRIHLVHGIVYVNGQPQDEPYAHKVGSTEDTNDIYQPERDDFPSKGAPLGAKAVWSVELPNYVEGQDLVVPPGQYFAMGDNRTNSADSRFWGFVPRENIVGRPMFVYWSFVTADDELEKTSIGERIAFYGHVVVHFFDQTRWRRTLHMVR